MGRVHVLHELDPGALDRVVSRLGGRDEVSAAEAQELLLELGKSPEDAMIDGWEDLEPIAELGIAHLRNHALLGALTLRSWDLDKSVHLPAGGFGAVFRRERSLRPLRDLFAGPSRDALPGGFYTGEVLVNIAKDAELVEAERSLAPFADGSARARIAGLRAGPLARLLGDQGFADAWSKDDYLWHYWRQLIEAVRTTKERDSWLGVVVG